MQPLYRPSTFNRQQPRSQKKKVKQQRIAGSNSHFYCPAKASTEDTTTMRSDRLPSRFNLQLTGNFKTNVPRTLPFSLLSPLLMDAHILTRLPNASKYGCHCLGTWQEWNLASTCATIVRKLSHKTYRPSSRTCRARTRRNPLEVRRWRKLMAWLWELKDYQ